jgi:MFS family permease
MTFGISVPAMTALQADIAPREVRGSIFGIQELFMNSGVLVGSILGGWITQVLATQIYRVAVYQIQGIALPFWITGTLGALTTYFSHYTSRSLNSGSILSMRIDRRLFEFRLIPPR